MSGIFTSGFGFLRVKVRVWFGSGSAFQGRVVDQNVGDFPLGLSGPRLHHYSEIISKSIRIDYL